MLSNYTTIQRQKNRYHAETVEVRNVKTKEDYNVTAFALSNEVCNVTNLQDYRDRI